MSTALSLDPRTTALVLIDLQNGILSMPLAPYDAAKIVTNASALGRRFSENGSTVVLVHVAFSDTYADKLNQPVDVPMPSPRVACRWDGRISLRISPPCPPRS